MKDYIIPLKLAKLAKEKEFNLDTIYHYSAPSAYTPELKLSIIELSKYNYEIETKNWNEEDDFPWLFYSAPTREQLLKWLREKHNLNFLSDLDVRNDKTVYNFIVCTEFRAYKEIGRVFEKYEDALDFALEKALNLIKIN